MRQAWRVFLTCWITYTVFWTPYIVREHFPAITLSQSGTLNVERFKGWTADIFESPRGGAFINNNPGASITGAIVLWPFDPLLARIAAWNRRQPRPQVTGGEEEFFWRTVREGLQFYFLVIAFVTASGVMATTTAATAAFLCLRLEDFGISASGAVCVSLLYALATPAFFRTALLNHNMLVCNAGFTALLVLWDPRNRPLTLARAIIAGLLSGYAVLCDYSGVVVVAVAFLYTWLRTAGQPTAARLRALAAFTAGVAPLIAALAIYQFWAFGSPALPSQHYMTPTAPTSHGYRGFDWPSLSLVWANFFDPRFGLFAYCPLLTLGLAAPLIPRARRLMPAREMWVLYAYFLLFVLFCAANQYSWLQPLTGFRYLAPVVPALALLAIEMARLLPRFLCWILASAAFLQSLVIAAAHENDIRLSVGSLWERHLAFFWMIRLRDAGLSVNWKWTLAAWLIPVVSSAFIWMPWLRTPLDPRHRGGVNPALS